MTRALSLICLAAFDLALAVTGVRAKPSIAVLGLEVVDQAVRRRAQDTQVAKELTDGLRASREGGHRSRISSRRAVTKS